MSYPYAPHERSGTSLFLIIALLLAGALVGYLVSGASDAREQPDYQFAAPPSMEANRVYGVNRRTGDMSVCQFERPEGNSVGITRCFGSGEGAGAQADGDYALTPTHYTGETGIFRVNRATGEMSICYVREMSGAGGKPEPRLLCTPPAK